jgi:hypothetical protein
MCRRHARAVIERRVPILSSPWRQV